MNVSRVVAAFAATSLLHSGPADATTATYLHPSAHHAFYSCGHSSSSINAPPSTQLSRAAESSLAASEALFTFSKWRQSVSSRTYYVPDVSASSALRKGVVDAYEPKKSDGQDVSVCDSENAIAQDSEFATTETDKCDRSAWFQPCETASDLACAGVSCNAELNGLLACGAEKLQVRGWNVTKVDGENELLHVQGDGELLTGEQGALDLDEIDKVLAVLDEDAILDASAVASSVVNCSNNSEGHGRDATESRPSDVANEERRRERQTREKATAPHAAPIQAASLLSASPASGETVPSHASASSLDWIDSLEVKNLSAIFSEMERSSDSIQQTQPSGSIKMPTGKVDSRVFVPQFSVRIEGLAAPVQRMPQLASSFSWAASLKPDSGFLVGPPSLFAASSQRAPSREDRVERWKLKRKTRPVVAAPRREPDAALSTIRRSVAAKRQRVGGRFVSSGVPASAPFVSISALQK